MADRGPVADLGCGPGKVTAHLAELGVPAFGVDLSPKMIELARQAHPGLHFEVGSMTSLAGLALTVRLLQEPAEGANRTIATFLAQKPGQP